MVKRRTWAASARQSLRQAARLAVQSPASPALSARNTQQDFCTREHHPPPRHQQQAHLVRGEDLKAAGRLLPCHRLSAHAAELERDGAAVCPGRGGRGARLVHESEGHRTLAILIPAPAPGSCPAPPSQYCTPVLVFMQYCSLSTLPGEQGGFQEVRSHLLQIFHLCNTCMHVRTEYFADCTSRRTWPPVFFRTRTASSCVASLHNSLLGLTASPAGRDTGDPGCPR